MKVRFFSVPCMTNNYLKSKGFILRFYFDIWCVFRLCVGYLYTICIGHNLL